MYEEKLISIIALILSVLGLGLWVVPFVGFSVSLSSLILAHKALYSGFKTTKVIVVLGSIGLLFATINSYFVYII